VPIGYDVFTARSCQTDVPALTSNQLCVQKQTKKPLTKQKNQGWNSGPDFAN